MRLFSVEQRLELKFFYDAPVETSKYFMLIQADFNLELSPAILKKSGHKMWIIGLLLNILAIISRDTQNSSMVC